jgi:hypothetical protein
MPLAKMTFRRLRGKPPMIYAQLVALRHPGDKCVQIVSILE